MEPYDPTNKLIGLEDIIVGWAIVGLWWLLLAVSTDSVSELISLAALTLTLA